MPSRAGNASSFSNTASSFSSTNSPLAANAGTNQTVNENSTVILVGAVSDPNPSAKLTYSWKQIAGPSVTLANNDTANPTFMSPSDLRSDTELKFLLMAKDDRGVASKPAIVTITVRHVNHPPVASAGQDQTVNSGDSVTLDGSASKDPDGDPIRYSWVQTAGPSVNLTGADRDITTFTAPSNIYSDTDLAFNLTVTDYKNTSSTTIVKVIDKYVPPLNQPLVANTGFQSSPSPSGGSRQRSLRRGAVAMGSSGHHGGSAVTMGRRQQRAAAGGSGGSGGGSGSSGRRRQDSERAGRAAEAAAGAAAAAAGSGGRRQQQQQWWQRRSKAAGAAASGSERGSKEQPSLSTIEDDRRSTRLLKWRC